MTAETGMKDGQKLKAISRISALAGTSVDLVARNARTKTDIDVLLRAMQAFKEGKLAAVVQKSKNALTDQDLLSALSLPTEDLPIAPEEKKYLGKRGVRYLGELYYVIFDPRSRFAKERGERIFTALAANLHVPKKLDPLAIGWTPPYWNHARFMATLDKSVLSCFGRYNLNNTGRFGTRWGGSGGVEPRHETLARRIHATGIHYMGSYLQDNRGLAVPGDRTNAWSVGKLIHAHSVLQTTKTGLWAAALVPPSWKSPESTPADWQEEEEIMRAEQETWERERQEAQARWEAEVQARHTQELLAKAGIPEPSPDEPTFEWQGLRLTALQIEFLHRECSSLEFSVRTANALANANIRFLWQLMLTRRVRLLKTKNFGRKSLNEIRDILSLHGLALDMISDPVIAAPAPIPE